MHKSLFSLLAIGFLAIFVPFSGLIPLGTSTMLFEESNRILNNPDRGIYVQVNTSLAEKMYEYAGRGGSEELRLVLLTYDLTDYRAKKHLGPKKLKELEDALEVAEKSHFSVIFRAAYGFDSDRFKDAESLFYILNHIEEICEVLNKHTDTILCVQAGMLGPYGEWHSSKYLNGYTDEAHELLMKWLTQLPSEVCVALRRPCYVREAVRWGADADRLTVHNDALLSTDSDMGTFSDEDYGRSEELAYIGGLKPAYMGGEMTNVSKYTDAENAVDEFDSMNICYLNRYYNKDVWKAWSKKKYKDWKLDEYINAHLGYRLSLRSITVTEYVYKETYDFVIENVGFGKLDHRVVFYLYVMDGEDGKCYYIPLEDTDEDEDVYRFSTSVIKKKGKQVGIAITRRAVEGTDPCYFIELANDETTYENGINYFNVS